MGLAASFIAMIAIAGLPDASHAATKHKKPAEKVAKPAKAAVKTPAKPAGKPAAKPSATKATHPSASHSEPVGNLDISELPRPAFSPSPVLLYRNVDHPAATADGITAWVLGDGGGKIIRFRAMASDGRSKLPDGAPGTTECTEPLWPAWISKGIPLTFTGWKKIHIPVAELTYRPPANAAPDSAAIPFAQADTIGFDTNRRSGVLYVDDVAWGGDDAADAGTLVDDFEGDTTGSWRMHGVPDALDAVDISHSETQHKNGVGSLKLDFTAAEKRTTESLVYLKRQINVSHDPCIVFVPKGPFERQTGDALPHDGEAATEINAFACAEQTISVSFDVYANTALSNVKATMKDPLSIPGHILPQDGVGLYVVKLAKAHGDGPLRDPDATTTVASLLVKDDRTPLALANGLPPTVRLTGDPQTDIPAHTQKQFWITVTVPANTPPGKYSGTVQLSSEQFASYPITFNLDVLPLRLMSPSKQYAVAYRGELGGAATPEDASIADGLTADRMEMQLRDIAAHGLRYVTFRDTGDNLWKALDVYNKLQMGYPFVYTGWSTVDDAVKADQQRKAKRASQFYFWTQDASQLAEMKSRGLQTAIKVDTLDQLAANKSNIDLVMYPIDHPVVKQLIAQNGSRDVKKRDWLWWTSAQSDSHRSRLYTGFLLWRANLYGAIASDYETAYSTDPFDDNVQPPGKNAANRPQMLTYPTQDGLISTVQWEAIRQGINDVRYMTTFAAAVRECRDNHLAPDLVKEASDAVDAFLAKPADSLTDADLEAGRMLVANYANKLRALLDAYYIKHPIFGSQPAAKDQNKELRPRAVWGH